MRNSKALAFYVTLSIMAFIASKIVIAVLLYRRWMRKRRIMEEHLSGGKMVMFRSLATQSLTSKACLKKTILRLTNKDIIGSGGYGTVYKLVIDSSTAFAVKRLNKQLGVDGAADGDRGFERELGTMGDIKHRNIVTLHGYYVTPQFNLLIYDLMPNGSLDCLLHGKAKDRKPLDWWSRCRIAAGAARGLSYLHHDCIPHIIHRDIKSSNILLDHNMEARVSDFGLATLMGPNETHVSTVVAGTFGYLAPEYFDTGRATTKGDVYSFGVVLLELLTGKRPTDETFIEEGTRLVTWGGSDPKRLFSGRMFSGAPLRNAQRLKASFSLECGTTAALGLFAPISFLLSDRRSAPPISDDIGISGPFRAAKAASSPFRTRILCWFGTFRRRRRWFGCSDGSHRRLWPRFPLRLGLPLRLRLRPPLRLPLRSEPQVGRVGGSWLMAEVQREDGAIDEELLCGEKVGLRQ